MPVLRFSLLLALLATVLRPAPSDAATAPALLSFDYGDLVAIREDIAAGKALAAPAGKRLLELADKLLDTAPLSVMDKRCTPPSGDKHDFFSIGNYAWPNPDTPDGLPYISRDGHRNPEAQDETFDKKNYGATVFRSGLFSLAWFYSGDEKYAAKAAQLLRVWFIDPATRMNPSLNYASGQPGVADGRPVGIIEGVVLIEMLDHVKLLSTSKSWTKEDDAALKLWFETFTTWLIESPFGKKEASMRNNHSTWHAAQVAAYSLYTGNLAQAKQAIEKARVEIGKQIDADGSMPHELKRNRSLMYSIYGLRPLAVLARAADALGEDLWHYKSENGRGLRLAFDFLAPYLAKDKQWPHEEVAEGSDYSSGISQAALMTRLAAIAYRSPELDRAAAKIAESLPDDERRARLLMRVAAGN